MIGSVAMVGSPGGAATKYLSVFLVGLVGLGVLVGTVHWSPGGVAALNGKMYWTDDVSDKVQRANLDGSDVEDLITALEAPVGIAVDGASGKVYWTDVFLDKIQWANRDGSGVEDLVTGLGSPIGIALDMAGGKMYWTELGGENPPLPTVIRRANLDGSGVEDLVTAGLACPQGIALDVAAGKMYWANTCFHRISRSNLDGSGLEDLIAAEPVFVAVDGGGGKMYWTEILNNRIVRANLDGTGAETVVAGLGTPAGIALDVPAGKVYWTETFPGQQKIRRADLDGSDVEELVTTAIERPTGIALDMTPLPTATPTPLPTATPTPAPPAVGGVVELVSAPSGPNGSRTDTQGDRSRLSDFVGVPLAPTVAIAALALGVCVWYAKRQWLT